MSGGSPRDIVSDATLARYRADGYVVVPGLLGAADLERWLARLEAIVEGRVPPAPGMLVMKDVMVVKGAVRPESALEAVAKLQDYERDPELDAYTTHPRLLDCVERFLGRDLMTIHTMLINKPPNVDGRHPLHQDLLYFPFRPADRIVATWTALEPVTEANGCLVVVPGSHHGELVPHRNPDWDWLNGGYWGAPVAEEVLARRVHLPMQPGDTVFFHPLLLHGSGRNRTPGFRRAISAHYASVDVEWAWPTRQSFAARRYRIVRGARAGQLWDGPDTRGPRTDPLDYIPRDGFGRSGPRPTDEKEQR